MVGQVLSLGYGSFGTVNAIVTLGLFTPQDSPVDSGGTVGVGGYRNLLLLGLG